MLDDPLLDVHQPGVVAVEDGPGLVEVEPVFGSLLPRDVEHGVEPGPDPGVLGRLFAHLLETIDLLADRGCDVLGQLASVELAAVVVGDVGVLAQLLLDGGELLAEDVLALRAVDLLGGLVSHLLAELEVGQHVAHEVDDETETGADIERLEHLDLLLQVEIGRIDDEISELAGVLHAEDAIGDGADAAMVHDLGDDGPELGDETLELLVDDVHLGVGLGVDPERTLVVCGSGAYPGAGHAGDDDVAVTIGFLDLGDGADIGVLAVDAWDEQEPAVIALGGCEGGLAFGGLDPQRDDHVGEDDAVAEGENGECCVGGVWHGAPWGTGSWPSTSVMPITARIFRVARYVSRIRSDNHNRDRTIRFDQGRSG